MAIAEENHFGIDLELLDEQEAEQEVEHAALVAEADEQSDAGDTVGGASIDGGVVC